MTVGRPWAGVSGLALIAVVLLYAAPTTATGAQCSDLAQRHSIRVLSINLLFSEFDRLGERLRAIAEFVARNRVDVVLLQEVVGGPWARTLAARLGGVALEGDTATRLRDTLADEYGRDFALARAFSLGLPGVLEVSNATLSRCPIGFNLVLQLPAVAEARLQGQDVRVTRTWMVTGIKVPGTGPVNVSNLHLCSRCSPADRLVQAAAVARVLGALELLAFGPDILGGDFNTDVRSLADSADPVYATFIGAGFQDTYADHALNAGMDVFCDPDDMQLAGCTANVSLIPDPSGDYVPRRLDYIFVKGLEVERSSVVFNPLAVVQEPSVSDHSAVFTVLRLP